MNATALFSLAARTALVTGGSKGLGRMIAEGFVSQGAKVYIAARDFDACRRTAERLSRGGGNCIPLQADLASLDGVAALADTFKARESALDILVNNAGAASRADFLAFSERDWDLVMDLNVKVPFFLSQALFGCLSSAAARRPAKIINISSVDGLRTSAGQAFSYMASKAALLHLTRQMAWRLIAHNIVVSAIAPGPFVSDMNAAARDHGELLAQRVPARRIGRPGDIAGAAIFLASEAGDYVVGDTLTVDGGFAHALPTHGFPLQSSSPANQSGE
jgi:NAD(P)-dependent dehydrogenase (short-subunit alcohol dehydrogenase family)